MKVGVENVAVEANVNGTMADADGGGLAVAMMDGSDPQSKLVGCNRTRTPTRTYEASPLDCSSYDCLEGLQTKFVG